MERYENVKASAKQILWNNFLGGIAWGLGATVGISILFAFLTFILKQVNLIPIFGEFFSNITYYVLQNNPNLR